MTGIKALRKIQLGQETTAGTAVAATGMWRGSGNMEDNRETVFVEEDVGYLSGLDRTHIPKVEGYVTFEESPVTFEQLGYILSASASGIVQGTQDGTGSGYTYTYNFPTTAIPTLQTYTIEFGDNLQVEEMAYAHVPSFSMTGAGGTAVRCSADWVGRQVANSSFSSVTAPTVDSVLFGKGKMYMNAASQSFGASQLTNHLLGFDLSVNTGIVPIYAADGNLYFSFTKVTPSEITCDFTMQFDADAVAHKAIWRSDNELGSSTRNIRLDFTGPALTTSGTSYANKLLRIDLTGKWESISGLEDADGTDTVTGSFRARYNTSASNYCKILIVNELSSLT